MKQYLDIVQAVLDNGMSKNPVRVDSDGKSIPVENNTIGLPNVNFSHDMRDGFPLLTTKKMAFKSLCVELEGFIRGITDKRWYQLRGCTIWNEWGNPERVKQRMRENETVALYHPKPDGYKTTDDIKQWVKKQEQKNEHDLGPIYGYQWRNFGQHYPNTWDGGPEDFGGRIDNDWPVNGVQHGTNQLASIINKLINNPTDRRMVCSAWNPNQNYLMALPPCHLLFNLVVYGNTLSLSWHQRSCDLMLGAPFNIASYAMLLVLLAQEANLVPYNLSARFADCHIYDNQIEQAKKQVKREPRKLPKVVIKNKSGNLGKRFNIFHWTHKDVELLDYNPLDKLAFDVTV